MNPAESRRAATWNLGSAEAAKEACRDARGTRWAEDLGRDARLALRGWRRRPGLAAAVILTLGLGIGTVTLMVSLVEGVLLKPLPFAHPDRLVRVWEQTAAPPSAAAVAEGWGQLWSFTYPDYRDLARESQSEELAGYSWDGDLVSAPGPTTFVNAFRVSANLFPLLGVKPIAGRNIAPSEDRPGGPAVALVGAKLARERFGSVVGAVGGPIEFAGTLYRVIGVMPPGFAVLGFTAPDTAQVFTALGQDSPAVLVNRGRHFMTVVGRLQAGASLAAAGQEANLIASRLQSAYPKTNSGRSFLIRPLRLDFGSDATTLWLLLGAAGLVLVLAVANIAGLLWTRALAEERVMALRAALGAGRGRLVRQCLTESVLFGMAGGALGLSLAAEGLRPFLAYWPGGLPRSSAVGLDGRVLGFLVALSLMASLLFGLAPAWRVREGYLDSALHSRQPGRRGAGLQRALVVAQMALALVLLAGAGALGGALVHLTALNLGVNPSDVLTGRVALPAADLSSTGAARAAWQTLLLRLRAIPGVSAATTVDTVPLREGNDILNYWAGAAKPPEARQPAALATAVGTDYFRVMGIQVRQGRVIGARDQAHSPPVVVIDENLARHAFGGRNPIGQQIHIGLGNGPWTVVGVVGHVRYWGPAGDAAGQEQDEVYYAFRQLPDRYVARWSQLTSIAVRTAVPPTAVAAQVRQAVQQSGAALYEVRTLTGLARETLAQQRFLLVLFSIFAALALLLAILGVYGVQAWLGEQRTPELAVRLALGARRAEIFWMLLCQELPVLGIGAAVGVGAAWAAGDLLRHAVAGVAPASAGTLAAAAALLVLAALAASLPPARRACRADPLATLRQE